MIASRGRGRAKCYYRCQMSRSFPATCSACHRSRCRFPPLLLLHCPLPVIALHLTPSVFLLPGDWHFLSCLYLTPLIPLSLPVSSAAQNPLWCTKTHLTGSRYHRQSQYRSEDVGALFVPGTIWVAPAFRSATNREGGKWRSDSFLTRFGMLTHPEHLAL